MLIKDVKAQIESLQITNEQELVNANDLSREILEGIKEVKESFKEEKDKAHKVHKFICDEEKRALKPWQDAQKVLKKAISDYMLALEEKRRQEVELAKEAEEIFGEVMEVSEKPDLHGTHFREYWEVEILDSDKVPVSWHNHVIRDINVSSLKEIAKMTEGGADIEGVKFYKKKVLVQR